MLSDVVVDTVVVVHAVMVGGDDWHGRGPVATVVDVVTVCYGSCCGQLAGRGSSRNIIEPFRQLLPPWRQCGRARSERCCAVGLWIIVGGSSSRKWFALARLVV